MLWPVAPLLAAIVLALLATGLHRRVRPQVSAVVLTCSIIGVTLAVVPTLLVLAIRFLVHLPLVGGEFEWCQRVLGFHAEGDPRLGAVAAFLVGLGAFRVVRSLGVWRQHRRTDSGSPILVESDDWFAYALPGPGRRVAVSTALVAALEVEELDVVLAHERGHARHRHDRHLLIAELAACAVPPVEWMRRRLRFALERWADEAAVEEVRGDRQRVASALAKVAVGPGAGSDAVAAFNGLGVMARLEALLVPQDLRHEACYLASIGVGLVAVLSAAALQTHHLVGLLGTAC